LLKKWLFEFFKA